MTSLTRSCVSLVHAHEVTVKHAKTDNAPCRGQAKQNQLVRGASRLVANSANVGTILRQRRGEDEDRRHTSGRHKRKGQ